MIIKNTGIAISGLVLLILLFGIQIAVSENNKSDNKTTIVSGLAPGQEAHFQSDLSNAMTEYKHIQIGYKLMEAGNINDAINEFSIALSMAKGHGEIGEAYRALADAYEKKKDYKKALEYVTIERDNHIADWAKESLVERAKYLEYAIKGDYDSAIEHAQKAIAADEKINNSDATRKDYETRLNDLKAAKDYIESLKNKAQ